MINLVRVGVFEEMTGVEKEFGWHSLAAMSAGFYSIKRILYCRPIDVLELIGIDGLQLYLNAYLKNKTVRKS